MIPIGEGSAALASREIWAGIGTASGPQLLGGHRSPQARQRRPATPPSYSELRMSSQDLVAISVSATTAIYSTIPRRGTDPFGAQSFSLIESGASYTWRPITSYCHYGIISSSRSAVKVVGSFPVTIWSCPFALFPEFEDMNKAVRVMSFNAQTMPGRATRSSPLAPSGSFFRPKKSSLECPSAGNEGIISQGTGTSENATLSDSTGSLRSDTNG
ncbi:hypothetical protein DFH94DRAFT_684908 [Russula ochroleuca]|uniref:Uncharacterized protein n=1 Tax=Russula ochroleuca TaxID=152965 RepID=A0A9P5JYD5_9AGAM|nr:hypothetical protein DFH94DRAFT_684908 [Russula ochroleuca]